MFPSCCCGDAGSTGKTIYIDSHPADGLIFDVLPASPQAPVAASKAVSATQPALAAPGPAVETPPEKAAHAAPVGAAPATSPESLPHTAVLPHPAATPPSMPAGPAAPVQPEALVGDSFVVEITKAAKVLGLAVDVTDENLCVIKGVVQGSTMHDWNNTCAEGLAVRGGHRVVSVNGQSGATNILVKKMQKEDTLKLTLQKPFEHIVTLKKNGKPLGISMTSINESFGVIIKEIQAGAALDANVQLKAGDRIINVNGQSGDPATLMQLLKSCDELELKVLTYK